MSDSNKIVPYDATRHLTPWKRSVLSREFRHSVSCMAGAGLTGTVAGGVVSFVLAIVTKVCMAGGHYKTHFLDLWMWIFIPIALLIFVLSGNEFIEDEDLQVVKAARERVLAFGRAQLASEPTPISLDVVLDDDLVLKQGTSRPLLFRLDAVLIHLDAALREIGPHEPAIKEATEVARQAFVEIMVRHKKDLEREHAEKDVLTRLRASCQTAVDGRIGDGRNVMPTAPTARIGRIVETAEKALAAHPNIVDAQGARVDDLIREHVPRLLQRHAEAARTAASQDVAEVDMALEQGVEDVRRSVEEALAQVRDKTMDALSTELRFLALRRGTQPVLTAVA